MQNEMHKQKSDANMTNKSVDNDESEHHTEIVWCKAG